MFFCLILSHSIFLLESFSTNFLYLTSWVGQPEQGDPPDFTVLDLLAPFWAQSSI